MTLVFTSAHAKTTAFMPFCSDPPVKQIIRALNEKEKCVIQELDDTHVLIRSDRLDWLKIELEKEVGNDNKVMMLSVISNPEISIHS